MSRPWMPLYVADYLRDTRRLTAAEHGAYLLLIMEYWTASELPADDRQLARIACMSASEWRKARPNVEGFFTQDWKHKRIDEELARSAEISSKRSASAKQKHSKSEAIAEQEHTHAGATSQSQPPDRIGSAGASHFTEGSKALTDAFWKAIGCTSPLDISPDYAGTDWHAVKWEQAGWTADLIDTETRRVGAGKPLSYYEKVFATAFAKRQAPLPVVEIREPEKLTVTHGRIQKTESLSHVARRHAESGIAFGERPTTPSVFIGPSGADVRLLPQGGSERPGDLRSGDGGSAERIPARGS